MTQSLIQWLGHLLFFLALVISAARLISSGFCIFWLLTKYFVLAARSQELFGL